MTHLIPSEEPLRAEDMVEDIDRPSVFVVYVVVVSVGWSGSCWRRKERVFFRLVLVVLLFLGIIEWFGSGLDTDFGHDIWVGYLRHTTDATTSVPHTQNTVSWPSAININRKRMK